MKDKFWKRSINILIFKYFFYGLYGVTFVLFTFDILFSIFSQLLFWIMKLAQIISFTLTNGLIYPDTLLLEMVHNVMNMAILTYVMFVKILLIPKIFFWRNFQFAQILQIYSKLSFIPFGQLKIVTIYLFCQKLNIIFNDSYILEKNKG